jgi:hypothetical protein
MKSTAFRHIGISLYFSLITLILISPSFAQTATETRVALVIGNARYTDSVSPLKNPLNDASDVSSKLKTLGWRVVEGNNLSRRDMIRKLSEFKDLLKTTPGATALFFYAGHGVQVEGKNYLLPIAEPFESLDDVRESAISLDRITDAFDEARSNRTLIILDACRDNPFTQKTRSISSTRGLAVVPAYELADGGSAVIFATMPNDVAADGDGRNGVFTASLLSYIDKGLNLQDMYLRVKDDVRAKTGGKQNPSLTTAGVLTGFYLGPTPAVVPSLVVLPTAPALAAASLETFQLRIQSLEQGIVVRLDGRDVGKTPFDVSIPKGIYTIELVHPDWNTWKETIKPNITGFVELLPKLERSDSWKLSQLHTQRNVLQANLDLAKSRQRIPKTITIYSIGITALGLATSTVAYFAGSNFKDAYDSATTGTEAESFRSKTEAMGLTFQVGIIAGGAGLAGSLFGLFTTPTTFDIEKEMKALDRQIEQLAGRR